MENIVLLVMLPSRKTERLLRESKIKFWKSDDGDELWVRQSWYRKANRVLDKEREELR